MKLSFLKNLKNWIPLVLFSLIFFWVYGNRHGFLIAYIKASHWLIPILCIYVSIQIYRYLFKQKLLRSIEQNINLNIYIGKSSFFRELIWGAFKISAGISLFFLLFIVSQSTHDEALIYFTDLPEHVLFPCSVSDKATEEMQQEIKKFWGKTHINCNDDYDDESKW
jgi:hypothetical protein